MGVKINVKTKLDGKFLAYHRPTGKLSFSSKEKDGDYLTVGMVWGGTVAGHPVAYWVDQIAKENANGSNDAT